MGRGRAKAKQQKVARDLKYNSHFTDLEALQRELAGAPESPTATDDESDDEDDEDDDESWARSGS
jgi:hypothetical protein